MAHASGLDEPAALEREQALWRQFVVTGRVDGAVGNLDHRLLTAGSALLQALRDRIAP